MRKIMLGDALEQLDQIGTGSVHCVVTSPPYWGQREYGDDHREMGREKTLCCRSADCGYCYLCRMVQVFSQVRHLMRSDGLLWLNLGDKAVSGWMMAVPQRVLIALIDRVGFGFGQEIVWCKTSSMPGGTSNRCNQAHEPVYMFGKDRHYFYDDEVLRIPEGKGTADKAANPATVEKIKDNTSRDDEDMKGNGNKTVDRGDGMAKRRSFWLVNQSTVKDNLHVAPMPVQLANDCVRASTSPRGACKECGRAWGRVVERVKTRRARPREFGKRTGDKGTGNFCPNTADKTVISTLGFYPRCGCQGLEHIPPEPKYKDPAVATTSELSEHERWLLQVRELVSRADLIETVPCLVLDPFSGSGTTGAAAVRNHCDFVGVELYPKSAAASLKVIDRAAPQSRSLRRMSVASPEE